MLKKSMVVFGLLSTLMLSGCNKSITITELPAEESAGVTTINLSEEDTTPTIVKDDSKSQTEDTNTKVQEDEATETAENADDYYVVFTNRGKQEVESFAAGIKEDFTGKNWKSLSAKISYPITIAGNEYNNADEFLKEDWNSSIPQEFIDSIGKETCTDISCNSQGAMLCDGCLWFSDVYTDDNFENQELRIISIRY
ncbi:MAG: hypothetical protein HUJ71_02345 [Pseudobutyrivibrio sp.]|nr:hypothetical protein [Pseudobutyrivibrio sp.]